MKNGKTTEFNKILNSKSLEKMDVAQASVTKITELPDGCHQCPNICSTNFGIVNHN